MGNIFRPNDKEWTQRDINVFAKWCVNKLKNKFATKHGQIWMGDDDGNLEDDVLSAVEDLIREYARNKKLIDVSGDTDNPTYDKIMDKVTY